MAVASGDARFPVSFDAAMAGTSEYLKDPAIRLLVAFFQSKGLTALKHEDRQEVWYQDWIDYQARHELYASLLSPARYSGRGHSFNIVRLARFLEVFAFFSPSHAYSLQVSFLGLFPVLMSANEDLKREAVARLEAGGLFAFAVSERAHGSDLLANEFTLRPSGPTGLTADGSKYFIGNANAATMISVLARKVGPDAAGPTKRSPFVFFAFRPAESPAFQAARKIHTLGVRSAFVGEFQIRDHPVAARDIISQGREAWDAVFGTVNFGKFFLGFGAVGICEHSFAEAFAHLRRRILYGRPVIEMSHIQAATVAAFARLTAMKFYADRALDYLQMADDGDRRYLLFNAVQKAKVSTEGVKVIALLSDCLGARGDEAESYFEMAQRDVQLIPRLEGSTHINFGLTAQFLDNYFLVATPGTTTPGVPPPRRADLGENPYWWSARDRNPRNVQFAPALQAYEPLRSVANVRLFRSQVTAFSRLVGPGTAAHNPTQDAALLIGLGKCLATIAFAQLIAECCSSMAVAPALVSVLFHGLIEDLSAESLYLSAQFPAASQQRKTLVRLIRPSRTSAEDFRHVSEFIATRYRA